MPVLALNGHSSKLPGLLRLVSGFELNTALCSAFRFDLAVQNMKCVHLGLCLFPEISIHNLFYASLCINNTIILYKLQLALHDILLMAIRHTSLS